jgi:hypothetical protein
MRTPVTIVSALLVAVVGLVSPARATTAPAPPPLGSTMPASALHCHGDLAHSTGTPVLLVPGTTLTPSEFTWNYERVFSAAGRAWCAVTLPHHAMTDIAVAGAYVADAIAAEHARAHRRISVIGHSQGGMVPRWALKYWPATRSMVDDVIGLAPSNHGTVDAYPVCLLNGCAPAIWQQQTGSQFLTALNRGRETYRGISYTQVYTATDEVVVPNLGPAPSSRLTTGPGRIANVSVQSICPVHVSEHLSLGTSDPVAYALALDALDHRGPAKASRVSRSVCRQAVFPGIDLLAFPAHFAAIGATAGEQVALAPHVSAEPPLPAYAR